MTSFFDLIVDHASGCWKSLRGVRYLGFSWLCFWLAFVFSPLWRRAMKDRVIHFQKFNARLHQADIYTFAHVVIDYDVQILRRELNEVSLIVDAGANVGSFSYLAIECLKRLSLHAKIIALEPDKENFAFLLEQPFASNIDCRHVALGAESGWAHLEKGANSASHTVHFGNAPTNEAVPVLTLAEVCDEPTLLKMDVEGSEFEVLEKGLPSTVKSMFLEWHPALHPVKKSPRDFLPHGTWELLGEDIYGSSCWFWKRS